MKKQTGILNLVHSKKALTAYVIVGLIYSVISVVAPSISGDLVNSVIYRQGNIKFYLILLILTYLFLLVLSVLDQHVFMSFKIKEKKAMRNELFASFLKKKGQNSEQVAAFSSFVNNDMPCVVEDYNGVQHSLLSGANAVRVTGFGDAARNFFWKNQATKRKTWYTAL